MRLIATLTVAATLLGLVTSEANASFTVNANVGGNNQTCSAATTLSYVPGSPATVNYFCSSTQTSNSCTTSGALNYALGTTTVDVPCSNLTATGLIVDATFGGVENGDGTQTPSAPGGVCSNATSVGYTPDSNTFTWTCGSFVGICQPISTTTFDLAANRVAVACAVAAPTGTGAASPSSVVQTTSTLLTVGVIPASNPSSTGITVAADLSSIGGAANQPFFDDGSHGDATAADGVYSFSATVPFGTTAGSKLLTATIADAQLRTSNATIGLTVVAATNPSGIGLAAPATVAPTGATLLTVGVTGGSTPASAGLTVTANLGAIGGSPTQSFYDDGSHGDATAGDGVYSFNATVPFPNASGAKALPFTVADSLGRTGNGTIDVSVLASTSPTGFAIGTPDNVGLAGITLLTVRVQPGKFPSSTGVNVGANLTGIGGAASQAFLDDGQNGDAVAGDGIFTYQAIVGPTVPAGLVNLPVSVTDAQARTTNTAIALNITSVGGLAASGNTGTATVGKPFVFRVTVTPGTAPASTSIMVGGDLTSIGGSSTQMFFDDGQNGGDQTAGDNVFTFLDTLPVDVPSGPMRIQAVATDAQGRSAATGIVIDVRGDAVFGDGYDFDQ